MAIMLHVLVIAVVLATAATSFVLQPQLHVPVKTNAAAAPSHLFQQPPTLTALRLTTTVLLGMADGENEVKTAEEPSSSAEEQQQEEAAAPEEEVEEVKEDPELVALKDEIKTLELTLKSRRQQVQTMQDRAEHYSKAGYARKVAEMENMRRDRSRLQSSNSADATAVCLAEFLPVWDRLMELKEQYQTHSFGKSYNSLADLFQQAYTDLGVTEYTVATGDIVDKSRMLVVDAEYSDLYSADTVLRPVRMGMELQGYIVRYAECVASLGPESSAAAADSSASSEQTEDAAAGAGDI